MPKYISIISNPRQRLTITKLRTHTHCLQTETGSYEKNRQDSQRYICKKCDDNKTEDIKHFLFECKWSKLIQIRNNLLNFIQKKCPELYSKPIEIWVSSILESNFPELENNEIQTVYKYVHRMYHIREKEPPTQNESPS